MRNQKGQQETRIKYTPSKDVVIITLATIIITVIANYLDFFEWFSEWSRQHESWEIDEIIAATFFLTLAMGIRSAILRNRLKQQLEKTRMAEAELSYQLNEKIALLKELNHRVKNNLTLIHSLASIKSQLVENKETRTALEEIESQIIAISNSHDLLSFEKQGYFIDLKEYLSRVGIGVLNSCGRFNDIDIIYGNSTVNVNQKTGTFVGLVFTELLLNSIKHAFPGGQKGTIQLKIKNTDNRIQINISDNGTGKIDPKLDTLKSSVGLGLVRDIIEKQLSGKVEYITNNGFMTKLTIPNMH